MILVSSCWNLLGKPSRCAQSQWLARPTWALPGGDLRCHGIPGDRKQPGLPTAVTSVGWEFPEDGMGYPSNLALLESRSCLGHLDPEQNCSQAGTATAPEREREVCVCPSLTRRPPKQHLGTGAQADSCTRSVPEDLLHTELSHFIPS